jgi:hypothetical protein
VLQFLILAVLVLVFVAVAGPLRTGKSTKALLKEIERVERERGVRFSARERLRMIRQGRITK